jgi:hypothetical protein
MATTSSPSISHRSRQSGSPDVSQPHGPPRPVSGIALLFSYFTHHILMAFVLLIKTSNIQ